MEMGHSHAAAFGRSMADKGVSVGIIAVAANAGKTALRIASDFM